MVLLVDNKLNGKLKNKAFPDKKALLIKSNVPLDDVIRNANDWQAPEILKRTKQLAKLAYDNIWKV